MNVSLQRLGSYIWNNFHPCSKLSFRRNGKDGADIWLSIMGEVYDVTMGKEYYAPGASYGAFAGRDASVPFCTGKFNAEESEKSTEVLKSTELPGLANWLDFYRKHKVYKFVGKLIDPRYFDEKGEPTSELRSLQMRILKANEEQALKAKIRREKRLQSQQEKASQENSSHSKASQEKASTRKGSKVKDSAATGSKAKGSKTKVSKAKASQVKS